MLLENKRQEAFYWCFRLRDNPLPALEAVKIARLIDGLMTISRELERLCREIK